MRLRVRNARATIALMHIIICVIENQRVEETRDEKKSLGKSVKPI